MREFPYTIRKLTPLQWCYFAYAIIMLMAFIYVLYTMQQQSYLFYSTATKGATFV